MTDDDDYDGDDESSLSIPNITSEDAGNHRYSFDDNDDDDDDNHDGNQYCAPFLSQFGPVRPVVSSPRSTSGLLRPAASSLSNATQQRVSGFGSS